MNIFYRVNGLNMYMDLEDEKNMKEFNDVKYSSGFTNFLFYKDPKFKSIYREANTNLTFLKTYSIVSNEYILFNEDTGLYFKEKDLLPMDNTVYAFDDYFVVDADDFFDSAREIHSKDFYKEKVLERR